MFVGCLKYDVQGPILGADGASSFPMGDSQKIKLGYKI
jgi:hypothetical protein